jgi:hypothetical protein
MVRFADGNGCMISSYMILSRELSAAAGLKIGGRGMSFLKSNPGLDFDGIEPDIATASGFHERTPYQDRFCQHECESCVGIDGIGQDFAGFDLGRRFVEPGCHRLAGEIAAQKIRGPGFGQQIANVEFVPSCAQKLLLARIV